MFVMLCVFIIAKTKVGFYLVLVFMLQQVSYILCIDWLMNERESKILIFKFVTILLKVLCDFESKHLDIKLLYI